jgi:hypothetical protein
MATLLARHRYLSGSFETRAEKMGQDGLLSFRGGMNRLENLFHVSDRMSPPHDRRAAGWGWGSTERVGWEKEGGVQPPAIMVSCCRMAAGGPQAQAGSGEAEERGAGARRPSR